MKTLGLLAIAAAMLAPGHAFALDVQKSVETKASPKEVWATIGDFCGIGKWHPAVEKCVEKADGGVTMRDLTLGGGGGTLVESLVSRDDKAMSYTYKIVSGPLPVDHYVSTISVMKSGSGSMIMWKGKFDAKGATDAKAEEVIGGIYDSGLKAIVEKAGT